MEEFETILEMLDRARELHRGGRMLIRIWDLGADRVVWTGFSAFYLPDKQRTLGLPTEQNLYLKMRGWKKPGYSPETMPGYDLVEPAQRWF